ncbi:MAG: hypothetical protein MH472_00225 [Bacteroidia bacterium]|nr:hypothetical protein [Bacteroidia bacterium]
MKTLSILFTIGVMTWANQTHAQINTSQLKKLNKQAQTVTNTAKNTTTNSLLSTLDSQLKQKFKLDDVKSELSGETLRVKAASAAYSKLPASAQNAQGKRILEGASKMIGSGEGLKSLNIKTLAVDMVKDMTVSKAVQSFSKQLSK